jgi:hypothetical protein
MVEGASSQLFDGVTPDTWSSALRLVAAALPDGPAIVVLDEFPWLCESSPSLEGELQVAWDRLLEARPVLVILIGSDISMMEALSTYERPLFGRVKEMAVEPLVRDCVERIAGTDPELDGVGVVGGYWTRTNDLEVDLVGVDRWPDAQTIGMVGSIKWRAQRPFDQHDFTELAQAARRVPGASDVKLVAASRMGCTAAGLDCVYGPADLVSALH